MAMTKLTRLKPEPQGIYDASKSYGVNSLVTSTDGVRVYLSVKDVPAGTPLTNSNYYVIHTDLTQTKVSADNAAAKALAARNEMIEIARGLTDPVAASGNPVYKELAGGIPFDGLKTEFEPIQAGSGDSSPSNIRPISGWTGAVLMKCGKNLLPNAVNTQTINGVTFTVNEDGSITVNGTSTSDGPTFCILGVVPLKKGQSYIFTGCPTGGGSNTYSLTSRYPSGAAGIMDDTGNGAAFTADADIEATCSIRIAPGYKANKITLYPMIRLTAVADASYQSCKINTKYTRQFGQTVYGGTIDWQTGAVTVKRIIKTFTGTETPTTQTEDGDWSRFNYQQIVMGAIRPANTAICTHYKRRTDISDSMNTFEIHTLSDYPIFRVDKSRWPTVDAWKTYLAEQNTAGTPLQICYELATPQTIQLTAEEIKQLNGVNTLYGDGTITINGRQRPGQNG